MAYVDATIYFLTGTGNSFRVAAWLAEAAQGRGITARVLPIQSGRPAAEVKDSESSLVGLVMPTHGFTAPWPMIRFALRMPRRRRTHAFVMPTRAGTKIGRFFLPGLEGTAGYLIASILALRGYRIQGALAADMPSNWMAVHPGFSAETARAIAARTRRRVLEFGERVLGGERYLGGIVPLVLGLALLPVSVAYVVLGRFVLAKLFFASSQCTGCGLCAAHCPHQAIRMWRVWGSKEPRPYWTYNCDSCMRCMAYCPTSAVEVGHSFGAILYYVTTIPAWAYLLDWLAGSAPILATLRRGWLALAARYAYVLLSVYLAYLLFTLLLRLPVVNRLFTVTTLTHYWRRYHEPDTGVVDLSAKPRPVVAEERHGG